MELVVLPVTDWIDVLDEAGKETGPTTRVDVNEVNELG